MALKLSGGFGPGPVPFLSPVLPFSKQHVAPGNCWAQQAPSDKPVGHFEELVIWGITRTHVHPPRDSETPGLQPNYLVPRTSKSHHI